MHEDRLWLHGHEVTEGEVMTRRCFACDRKLGRNPALVITEDGQTAFIGSECLKEVVRAKGKGWRGLGGPRLFTLEERPQQVIEALRRSAVNASASQSEYERGYKDGERAGYQSGVASGMSRALLRPGAGDMGG